ncbi:hypothetical protein MMC22_004830 [Lobaria immixta]|nr:hypothetical protein [Lobaria immixta]
MSDNGPSLSIAALAVALVALVVALGQILGQYFATAEGYRRCQASVMGPWARKTRMQWRWSQFRFETFFTTPELVLQDYSTSPVTKPGVISRERSWDFMSPEIVRPFAVTNISDIAVMARRMGMTWTDFRPEDGILRAEGNGHVFSSTLVRSIGMILQYMHVGPTDNGPTRSRTSLQPNIYIPTREADMLGFGILPGFEDLSIPPFKIGTINDVYATMNILDKSRKASKKIKDVRGIESTCTFGFSDLIPLAAPMMRLRGSTVIGLPIPTEYFAGLTCHKEGFVVFYNRLQEYIDGKNRVVSDQIKWVLGSYESLKARYTEWENEAEAIDQDNNRNLEFLENVHTYWDSTSDYFIALEKDDKGLRYYDLMASHTSHAVNYWGDAWSNIRGGKARDHYGLCDWIAEGAHKYFDYLPHIAEDMKRKGANTSRVDEAWIVMMFRAFCWWRCHYMNPGENSIQDPSRIPSRYWNSKLPVYIG